MALLLLRPQTVLPLALPRVLLPLLARLTPPLHRLLHQLLPLFLQPHPPLRPAVPLLRIPLPVGLRLQRE